jgi:hypothetical protein
LYSRLTTAILIAAVLSTCAEANIIRVPSEESTIQDGINVAAHWDTVLVSTGIYYENISIRKPVTLTSVAGAESTVISGSGPPVVSIESAGDTVVLAGFTITGGYDINGYWGGGVSCYGTPIVIEGNVLLGNGGGTMEGVGAIFCQNPWSEIIQNTLIGNAGPVAGGISCVGNGRIEGNWVQDNWGTGIDAECPILSNAVVHCSPYPNGGGGTGIKASNTEVANNTVIDCSSHGIWLIGDCSVHNNVVASNGRHGVYCGSLGQRSLYCNDVFGNTWEDYGGICGDSTGYNGNISEDPVFCSPDSLNLTLGEASPCAAANSGGCGRIGALGVGCYLPVVVSPDGGERFYQGQTHVIEWVVPDSIEADSVDISYLWGPWGPIPIGSADASSGAYMWEVDVPAADNCRVHILAEDSEGSYFDTSDSVFSVVVLVGAGAANESELPLEPDVSLWPNPARRGCMIEFTIPTTSHVSLEVFNLCGQRVTTLLDGHVEAGRTSVKWSGTTDSGTHLPSGVYFCKISCDGVEVSKKLVLLE